MNNVYTRTAIVLFATKSFNLKFFVNKNSTNALVSFY